MRPLLLVAALVGLAAPATAQADDAPRPAMVDSKELAKQRYATGQAAFREGRFAEAALYLEAATSENANALAVYGAGLAWEKANLPDRAADAYARAITTPGLPLSNLQDAKEKLALLEGVLGRVDVTAPGDAWFVQVDGNTEQACPAQLHATPGMHTLRVRTRGRPMERRGVAVGVAQVLHVDLASPSDEAPRHEAPAPLVVHPAPPTADVPVGVHLRRTAGLVTMGAGVAMLASGVVLGLQALDAKDAYNAAPSRGGFDHADALQSWTNVAFVAGGIFAVGGAALVFWPAPKGRERGSVGLSLVPSLGGALLQGSFR